MKSYGYREKILLAKAKRQLHAVRRGGFSHGSEKRRKLCGSVPDACDTQCGSFSNKACDCEVSAELAIHKETDVHCDAAKCKYNDHNSCMANQIGIKKNCTPNKCSTECASFECQA